MSCATVQENVHPEYVSGSVAATTDEYVSTLYLRNCKEKNRNLNIFNSIRYLDTLDMYLYKIESLCAFNVYYEMRGLVA